METSNSAPTGPHEKLAEKVTPATPTSLAVDRSRIAEIEAQLLELERSAHALREEKESVQSRLDAYTYPVLTLPTEIVSEIFGHFLPVYPKRPPIRGLLSPFTLGQICRTWREIALSTPRLWRAVAMSPSPMSTFEQQLHLTQLTLARSGFYLPSISINSTDGRQTPSVVQVVAPHCERWEHLKLSVSLRNFPPMERILPWLRTLTLNDPFPEDDEPTGLVVAPLLRKVALGVAFSFSDFWRSKLPWSQLLVLTIDDIEVHDCALVLGFAPNVVFCRFRIEAFDSSANFASLGPCQLETLVLRTGFGPPHWDLVAGLCNSLTFPALRELQVAEIFLMPNPVAALGELLSRSGCSPSKNLHHGWSGTFERFCEVMLSVAFYEARQPPRFYNIEDAEELEWVNGHSNGGEPDEDSHSR
ncbi:hypothetical protein B0H16DRAFT_1541973 [Mycena metata]|uniref:F-box domain-containing protein n=1 Tax=Mycena metata TaxID=1033252 RepID=A0AAD7ND66_9AGAR|nr:hypothetical protein B0H16DRAFT_1541973 [Mycena metata]